MAAVENPMTGAQPEQESPVHGDILELILSHAPLIDLAPASYVSKSWNLAVASSLLNVNPIKPWLLLHTQTTHSPYSTTTHAYDPRSHLWLQIHHPSLKYISALRSSHSTFLYMLSPSKFSFSYDPLHLTWHHTDAPLVWRTDPIVSLVGRRVVIAGGTCDFIDDPLAVEIYDLDSQTWDTCESLPSIFKDYAASTWLSIAVDDRKMYIKQRNSGVVYSFDPITKIWCGPYDLSPETEIFSSVIGFANGRLVLVGLLGTGENLKGVKVWEVKEGIFECEKMGEMPKIMVEKMKGDCHCVPSITLTCMGDFLYLHNGSDPGEVIVCEIVHGSLRWESVRNVVVDDRMRMQRMVFTSSNVCVGDLQRAMWSENRKFQVREYLK